MSKLVRYTTNCREILEDLSISVLNCNPTHPKLLKFFYLKESQVTVVFNSLCLPSTDKKSDLSPTGEEWGVDANTISKLKEEYKKSRKDKKFIQRKSPLALRECQITLYSLCVSDKSRCTLSAE